MTPLSGGRSGPPSSPTSPRPFDVGGSSPPQCRRAEAAGRSACLAPGARGREHEFGHFFPCPCVKLSQRGRELVATALSEGRSECIARRTSMLWSPR